MRARIGALIAMAIVSVFGLIIVGVIGTIAWLILASFFAIIGA